MVAINYDVAFALVVIFELCDDTILLCIREDMHLLLLRNGHPFVREDLFGCETQVRVFLKDTLEQC